MDRNKFSAIAYRYMDLCSPVSRQSLDEVLRALDLEEDAYVLDIGCGKGELLLRLAQLYPIRGLGIDLTDPLIEEAKREAAKQLEPGRLEFWAADVTESNLEPESFDLAVCMGAGGAFGGTEGMLKALKKWVKPGGLILVDSGYWRQPPSPDYLAVLGATGEEYGTHFDNERLGIEGGLVPLYSRTSSQQEWDHFEGLYMLGIERYCARHPEDEDVPKLQKRIRRWRDAYRKWGRDTLGYGLYLFLKPPAPATEA